MQLQMLQMQFLKSPGCWSTRWTSSQVDGVTRLTLDLVAICRTYWDVLGISVQEFTTHFWCQADSLSFCLSAAQRPMALPFFTEGLFVGHHASEGLVIYLSKCIMMFERFQ